MFEVRYLRYIKWGGGLIRSDSDEYCFEEKY